MNKLKLFSKTYIFTMGIISLIILISNVLIYLALPKVYVNNKQKEADKIIEALIEQVSKSDNEESFKIAKNFAEKYNIQVLLTIGDEKRVFQGLHKVDIYVNEEEITENSLIIPNLIGENIIENFNDENREVIGDDGFGQYININNLSIIKSRDFKKSNDVNGSAPYLELEYVKDEVATTSASEKDEDAARNLETKNTKAGDSESKGAEAEKQKDPDEELYWIQPYGEENQEPIVITVYKK